jgi:hypothetical protein
MQGFFFSFLFFSFLCHGGGLCLYSIDLNCDIFSVINVAVLFFLSFFFK